LTQKKSDKYDTTPTTMTTRKQIMDTINLSGLDIFNSKYSLDVTGLSFST